MRKKYRGGADINRDLIEERGLPLGNVTSQIFANIYLNKLDWFIKKQLRVKHYFRYTDDFIIIHTDTDYLKKIINRIQEFLETKLDLELHPQKVQIREFKYGIDFLGYIVLPYHKVLRTKTKQRMFKKLKLNEHKFKMGLISQESFEQSLQSYLGMLKHCDGYKLKHKLLETTGKL